MVYIFKIKFNSSSLENELIPVFLNEQSAYHPQNGFLFMIFPVILRIILIGTYSEVPNKQAFFLITFSACAGLLDPEHLLNLYLLKIPNYERWKLK